MSRQQHAIQLTSRRALWGLLVGATFVLGWFLGKSDKASDAPTAASTSSAQLRPRQVELRLDGDNLTLLPEQGLTLRPLPPLDVRPLKTAPSAARSKR